MAEEGVLAPPPTDLKRKLEDIEPEAPQLPTCPIPEEPDAQETALVVEFSASPDVKRPRLDDTSGVFMPFFLVILVPRPAPTRESQFLED